MICCPNTFSGEIYQRRYTDRRLAQAQPIIAEADDLKFEDNTLDAASLVLTWHDFLCADPDNTLSHHCGNPNPCHYLG